MTDSDTTRIAVLETELEYMRDNLKHIREDMSAMRQHMDAMANEMHEAAERMGRAGAESYMRGATHSWRDHIRIAIEQLGVPQLRRVVIGLCIFVAGLSGFVGYHLPRLPL